MVEIIHFHPNQFSNIMERFTCWSKYAFLFGLTSLWFMGCQYAQNNPTSVSWDISRLDSIGGFGVIVLGDPEVVSTDIGDAVEFDGVTDQLLVRNNPIGEAKEFTVEVVFWPNDVYPDNADPRFVHIQDPIDPDNKRLLIELRLNDEHECYMDGFLLTDSDNLALIDEFLVHPTETWLHAAVTYKDGVFRTYMNGIPELRGNVGYQTTILPATGQTSLGARMDERNYFSGKIKTLRVTQAALEPEDFLGGGNPTRIVEEMRGSLSVYPNPADQSLTIAPEADFSAGFTAELTDMLGQSVRSAVSLGHSSGAIQLSTLGLTEGMYVLHLSSEAGQRSQRIWVRH